MLSQKDEELDSLRGRTAKGSSPQQTTTGRSRLDETQLASGDGSPHKGKQLALPTSSADSGAPTQQQDYIKNVFIKYLEYLANSNEKEAMTLEKVLFTVL
jgi:hypothetical protein